jgi:predicted CXXCH cytochrome family protein
VRPRRLALLASVALAAGWLAAEISGLRLRALAERPLLPTRFDHKFHKTVGCTTCHHNFGRRGLGPKPCLACHKAWGTTEARRIDTVFHAFCTGCHAERRAAGRKAGPVKACAACHVRPDAATFEMRRR